MKTTTIFETLKSEELAKIIKNDQRLTKHKMTVKFNTEGMDDDSFGGDGGGWGFNTQKRHTAMDENYIKIKGHVLGPQTTKIEKMFAEYKNSCPKELIPSRRD
jgi:hypothetical protein